MMKSNKKTASIAFLSVAVVVVVAGLVWWGLKLNEQQQYLEKNDRIEGATIRNGKLTQGNFVFADGSHKFISGLSETVR